MSPSNRRSVVTRRPLTKKKSHRKNTLNMWNAQERNNLNTIYKMLEAGVPLSNNIINVLSEGHILNYNHNKDEYWIQNVNGRYQKYIPVYRRHPYHNYVYNPRYSNSNSNRSRSTSSRSTSSRRSNSNRSRSTSPRKYNNYNSNASSVRSNARSRRRTSQKK